MADFQWKISNLSCSWLKKNESIESPTFNVGTSPTVTFSLVLYPKGIVDEEHVGIFLRKENDVGGTKIIEASFYFAFLNEKGSVLNKRHCSKRGFAKGSVSGIGKFLKQDKIFGPEKEKLFPGDILIVQCTVWKTDEMIPKRNISAQTRLKINERYFLWGIDGFSTLLPGQRNDFIITNEFKNVTVRFSLVLGFKKEINLEILAWHESLKYFSFEISIIDSERREVTFDSSKFFTFHLEKRSITLLWREQLIENESKYLPNDVLTLACQYAFSTGEILHIQQHNNFGIISRDVSKEVIESLKEPEVSKQNEPQQALALVDDLKFIHSEAVLCDIDLRTPTKTFPAHKTILSARSHVFRRMFSSDMKENNTGHVDITDLEDDTVHRMLLYIYTDFLDLQFESASKLYSAADKYAILSLKEKCSCFLKDNISTTKACDLLTLADRHQDDDLKCAVQDYILAHGKKIFGSLEWKDFMLTNLQLAADIMVRKLSET